MGVDSGLPDFRGDRGFWKAYPPFERLGCVVRRYGEPNLVCPRPRVGLGLLRPPASALSRHCPSPWILHLEQVGRGFRPRLFCLHLQRRWSLPASRVRPGSSDRVSWIDRPPPVHRTVQQRNLERQRVRGGSGHGQLSRRVWAAEVPVLRSRRETQRPHVRRLALDPGTDRRTGTTIFRLARQGGGPEARHRRARRRLGGADCAHDLGTDRRSIRRYPHPRSTHESRRYGTATFGLAMDALEALEAIDARLQCLIG